MRRKFFYSDQNIDSRDPVQLNLLYVQARDAILDGTHPVTQEKGKKNKINEIYSYTYILYVLLWGVCVRALILCFSLLFFFFCCIACEFAGIQAHIQFGDYNEQKHKQGFLE